jgi:hypothetical protein
MASLSSTNSRCGRSSAEPPPTQTTLGAASFSTSARIDTLNKIIFQWKAHTYKKLLQKTYERKSESKVPYFIATK